MSARHLVLGLDGADLDAVLAFGPGRLPNLHALMARGAYAHLESVKPEATLPNWTTFLTGVDPGRHGVFDFTVRDGHSVRFVGGTLRAAPTIWKRLDKLGHACAVIGFPATYPPEQLEHGYFVSGWDAPVAFAADRSFVHPPTLYDDIVSRFGEIRFDDVDEFDADEDGWHARLPAALERRIGRRLELARFLLDAKPWHAFAIYFGEIDTGSHHLASLCDANSPRNPHPGHAEDGLARVYAAIDAAVGALVAQAGEDVEITIVSDHGSGSASDKVLYLNRALERAGLFAFTPSRAGGAIMKRAKDLALTMIPPRLRDRIFRMGGAILPSWLESRARFAGIDWARTRAFSDELNYFPAVWLNLRGREPHGTVDEADREAVRREVRSALLALRDPFTNAPIVADVIAREVLYDGPYVERAPDLVVILALDAGYTYNVLPSGGPGEVVRRLRSDELLGRKGRSMPGSHRPFGLFVAAGPSIADVGRIDAKIADATATLLVRMGCRVPDEMCGRVLFEVLAETVTSAGVALPSADVAVPVIRDEASVAQRLRALGYIDP